VDMQPFPKMHVLVIYLAGCLYTVCFYTVIGPCCVYLTCAAVLTPYFSGLPTPYGPWGSNVLPDLFVYFSAI